MLKPHEKHGRLFNLVESALLALNRGYRSLLQSTLRVRPLIMLLALGVTGAGYFLLTSLKAELAPIEDRGVLFTTGLAPEGSTIDFTNRYSAQMQTLLKQIPDVETYFVITGSRAVNELISFSRLKPWDERQRTQMQIAAELQPKLAAIPGVRMSVNNPGSFGQSPRARPIEFVIQTADGYDKLEEYVNAVMAAVRNNPGLVNLDSDLDLNKPQLQIDMDRTRIADRDVSVLTVGRTLETLLGGRKVTKFIQNGEQYDVFVQVQGDDRRTPGDLNEIYVRGRNGSMIQLTSIVSTREGVAPKELNRFNQFRSATITANLAPGYALGEALQAMEQAAQKTLPPSARYEYAGVSREFKDSGSSLVFIFILALAFIFLVLAAQFESFVDPLIIMFTVPLSLTGALLALNLTGTSLNIYSQIGLVTLIGLITKHGILIVQFANQLQDEGTALKEAIVQAASLRLRPILMTTGAMVCGAIPLALAHGAGAMGLRSVGWVIVGGMTFGTLLTLFVVPTAYSLLARDRSKIAAAKAAHHPVGAHQPAE